MLGPVLFNIFINNLFYRVKESALLINFADYNTISSAEFSVEKLLKTLETESQIGTDWIKENNMIVNADKFQTITVKQNSHMNNQYTLNIDRNQVTSDKSVKLLRINIDNKLSFNGLCKKASNQLNAISRLCRYLGFKKKKSWSIVSFMLILITLS